MANTPTVLIAGLQGTGKTLVAGVCSSLGYSSGDRRQGELISFASRHICAVLRHGSYPYTLPVDPSAPPVDISDLVAASGIALPQLMVCGCVAAVPSLLEYVKPDLLVVCQRGFNQWVEQVERTDASGIARARLDINGLWRVWASVGLLDVWPHVTFDVDIMRFGQLSYPDTSGGLTPLAMQEALMAILRADPRAYGG